MCSQWLAKIFAELSSVNKKIKLTESSNSVAEGPKNQED